MKKTSPIEEDRDKLREVHSELGDIIDSLDNADYDVSDGIEQIECDLDAMSGYL